MRTTNNHLMLVNEQNSYVDVFKIKYCNTRSTSIRIQNVNKQNDTEC